jgi:HemY protein
MRALFTVLLVAALAVAATLAARYNAGYVLLVVHPYRIELSLNLLLALILVAFAALYALLRIVSHMLRLPDQVRAFRSRRRQSRATTALFDSVRAFLEGRYAKAEQAALEAIDLSEHRGLAAVIAARSAHALRAYDRRDSYLARSAYYGEADRAMRAVTQAEMLLQARQHEQALSALAQLPHKHTEALRLELKAQQQARHWDRYLEVLQQLERAQALDEEAIVELRRHAVIENMAHKGHDLQALREYWQRLGAREREDPRVAARAAQALAQLGAPEEACKVIEQSLEREWDPELVTLYADCSGADPLRQIERAERWLRMQPNDPVLLLALGRLCVREQLWGKARRYIEASLSLEETFAAHMELARLLDEHGETAAARSHYERSLRLVEDTAPAARLKALPAVLPQA